MQGPGGTLPLRRWLSFAASLSRRATASQFSQGTYNRMYAKAERVFTKERRKRFGFLYGDANDEVETTAKKLERLGPSYYRNLDPKKRHQLSLHFLELVRAHIGNPRSMSSADQALLREIQITNVQVDTTVQNLKIFWLVSEEATLRVESINERLRFIGRQLRDELRSESSLGYVPRLLFYPDLSAQSMHSLNLKMAAADYPPDHEPSMDPLGAAATTVYQVELKGTYAGAKKPRQGDDWNDLNRDSLLRNIRPMPPDSPQSQAQRADYERRLSVLLQKQKRATTSSNASDPVQDEDNE